MKRTLSLLMAVLMLTAVVLTGCSSGGTTSGAASSDASSASSEAESESSAAEENDLLAQIKEKGTITVAMEGTWAPWTYHDTDDNLVGYDVEVAQNIAEKLGVEVNFVEGEWDGLLAGLDDGRYDIMVNGVGVTEERAEKYNFSTPYAYNRTAVIVRGDYDEINSMEDLEAVSYTHLTLPTIRLLCNAGRSPRRNGYGRGRSQPDHRASALRPYRCHAECRSRIRRLRKGAPGSEHQDCNVLR